MVLEISKLGLFRQDVDFTKGLSLVSVSDIGTYSEVHEPKTGRQWRVNNCVNKRGYSFINYKGNPMDLIIQVSNDGLALSYFFPYLSKESNIC
ncbi:glycoside hydrolase family 97 N-terminal domain-containing protein [Marinilabiliaceae bacterium N1Y90]|nr:glycoside hydrolase family 97 N-terminal domain-containing protein [Marinilabiliaceae bacterium N1Y90]